VRSLRSRWCGPRQRAFLSVLPLLVGGVAGTSCEVSSPARPARPAPATPRPARSCTQYLPPDPNRPVVTLDFEVSADHRTVTGREHVVFRPDRAVHELVFRLWPNGPEGGRVHASLTVHRASVNGLTGFHLASAGGRPGTQGTLLTMPLSASHRSGSPITADLDFTVRLPSPSWDRMGSDGRTAWWASAHPMLAWQPTVGWTRDPASPLPGETATSAVAATAVTVTAPAADQVLTGGAADPPRPAPGRRRRWHFVAPTARDVAVAVGPFRLTSAEIAVPAGPPVPVTVGVAPGLDWGGPAVLAEVRRALPRLVARFGPVPFPALRLAGVPGLVSSGIEYPAMVLLLGRPQQAVVTHELAHQWFYGLVGNNQARDPWLDEAFATYAEALVDPPPATYTHRLTAAGRVGASMASFGTDYARYSDVVYEKGAAALLAARHRAGAAAFDSALRCYLTDLAWQVATPTDVAAHLRHLPVALAVLHRVGAL